MLESDRRRGANRRGFIGLACFAAVAALVFVNPDFGLVGARLDQLRPGKRLLLRHDPGGGGQPGKAGQVRAGRRVRAGPAILGNQLLTLLKLLLVQEHDRPDRPAEYSGYMSSFGAANATETSPPPQYVDSNGNVVTGSDAGVMATARALRAMTGKRRRRRRDGGATVGKPQRNTLPWPVVSRESRNA